MMTWLHSEIPRQINVEVKSNPSAPLGVQILGFAQNMLVERSRDEKLIYVCVPLGSARGTMPHRGDIIVTVPRLRSECNSLVEATSHQPKRGRKIGKNRKMKLEEVNDVMILNEKQSIYDTVIVS